MSDGTHPFAWMLVCTFMPPFFFPVLGCLPTPLNMRLENRVIVVELSDIQAAVCVLKHGFGPADVGVRQCTAPWHGPYAKMGKFACLGKLGVGNLAQRVESLDDGVKHNDQMLVGIKVLHVAFSVMFALNLRISSLLSNFISCPYIGCPIKCVPLFIVT